MPNERALLLLAATHAELAPVARRLRLRWRDSGQAVGRFARWSVCGRVTGIGARRAVRCMERWLDEHGPATVIVLGFAGALDPTRRAGALLHPQALCSVDGRTLAVRDRPQHGSPQGMLLSLDEMLSEPEQKRQWFERTGAVAVDMESFAVAERGQQRGIDVYVLRAISDDAHAALPGSLARVVDAQGQVSLLRAVVWALKHPQHWAALVRLLRDTRRAGKALAEGAAELIAALEPSQVSSEHSQQ